VRPTYPFLELVAWPVCSLASSGADVGGVTVVSRDILRFHGPGESLANRGDGRGVRSPIAEMTGLATAELAVDAEPKAP